MLAATFSASTLNAAELKTFVGVNFGTKPTADKFEGPDEDGDYTFRPTFELGAYQFASVSLDDETKTIDTITLAQGFEDVNDTLKFFDIVNQNIKRHYSKVGIVEQSQGSALWDEVVKGYAVAGLQYKKLRIWATLNESGDVKQYVSVVLRVKESGSASVLVSATDNTVGKRQVVSGNTTDASAAKGLTSFLGLEFGRDLEAWGKEDSALSYYGLNGDKSVVNAAYKKQKNTFRMFGPDVVLHGCPTTRRMFSISVYAHIPKEEIDAEYAKCRDIICKKYGAVAKEAVVLAIYHEARIIVGDVEIVLATNLGSLSLDAKNLKLEKEAKEEYKASMSKGDDADAL